MWEWKVREVWYERRTQNEHHANGRFEKDQPAPAEVTAFVRFMIDKLSASKEKSAHREWGVHQACSREENFTTHRAHFRVSISTK